MRFLHLLHPTNLKPLLSQLRARFSTKAEGNTHARGLNAIEHTAPSPLPRTLMWILLFLFGVLLGWSLVGKLDIVATSEGKLVPATFLKIVQPSEGGIVKQILVKEGQRVEAGQVLVKMDAHLSDADTKALFQDLALKRLTLKRIDAELNNRMLIRTPDDPPELFLKVLDQYRAYRQSYQDAIAQEEATLTKLRQDLAGANQVKNKLERTLPFYEKQANTFDKLGKDGFASPLLVEDKKREFVEKDQELKTQQFAVSGAQAAIAQSEKRIAQVSSTYRQQLQTERIQILAQVEKLTQDWEKQTHKNALLELKAPQGGLVKDIASHTPGTVVTPGTILMTVVPQGEGLIAEVQVKNQDAGFVRLKQPARIKVASFPFQKYGLLDGEVSHLGADATDTVGGRPEETNAENRLNVQANYKAHVALKVQHLSAQGQTFELKPGMQVVAEIHLGERTIMEYLLSPVQKAVKEAGRER
jgi:HlyD family secretion protein